MTAQLRRIAAVAAAVFVALAMFAPGASAIPNGDREPSEPSPSEPRPPRNPSPSPSPSPTPSQTCAVAPRGYPAGSGFDADDNMLVVSTQLGPLDLWVAHPPTSSLVARMTASSEAEYDPTWDRTGNIQAWTTTYGGHYVVKVSRNGGNNAKIVNLSTNDRDPSISPNGTEIAFNRSGAIMLGTLCGDDTVVNVRRISPSDGASYRNPAFSPDASQILMTSNRSFGRDDVWRLVRATGAMYPVTCEYGDEGSWSPDGTQIAYTARGPSASGNAVVGVVTLRDCANVAWMTNLTTNSYRPSWSRTGTKIGFVRRNADNSSDVFTINTDRTGLRNVTASYGGGQRGYDFVWS